MRTRRNHYAPAAYLRGWANESDKVQTYALLVPHANVPRWKERSPENIAYRADLYTSVSGGTESDEFEQWITREVEEPALEPLRKVRADQEVTHDGIYRLARYALALDLRTPASYKEWLARTGSVLERHLDDATRHVTNRRAWSAAKHRQNRAEESGETPASAMNLIKFELSFAEQEGSTVAHASALIGREQWLASIRYLLDESSVVPKHLRALRFHVVRPHRGHEWFTSDHPLVRLNAYADGTYDFKAGWGVENADVLLPLSPQHLLYARVGHEKAPDTAPLELTGRLQRIIAEHAHRWIIARGRPARTEWWRRRVESRELYDEETEWWRQWHADQLAAETGSATNTRE